MIKLICFDLDDTLWPVEPTIRAAELRFYDHLMEAAPDLCRVFSPDALREHRLAHLKSQPELRHNISRWRIESLRHALEETGHGERSQAMAMAAFKVFLEARQQVELFEHCEKILAELSQSHQLIALTNGNADLSKMPVGQYFLDFFRAEQLGSSKPAPDLFEAALERAACSNRQAVHIGDHAEDDIRGAKGVGMFALQALLTGKAAEPSPQADGHFSHWKELPALIKSLK